MSWFAHSFLRSGVGVVGVGVVVAGLLTASSASANEAQQGDAGAVVGSFGVGAGVSGDIDARTGDFVLSVPVAGVPGVATQGTALGAVYRQDAAAAGEAESSFAAGWGWNVSQVLIEGGVRVSTPTGEMYEADASIPSGLARYTLDGLRFIQENGVLPARDGVDARDYAFQLVRADATEFFDATGHLLAQMDVYGHRNDFEWSDGHLRAIVDDGANRLTLNYTAEGVEIVQPTRTDGVRATTILCVESGRLTSIINALGEPITFDYEHDGDFAGLIKRVETFAGAVTDVTYQHGPGGIRAVDAVRVRDSSTGVTLSQREWDVAGEHTAEGFPSYSGQAALWGSADGAYQYTTILSDGVTKAVSTFNSLGLLLDRDMVVATGAGSMVLQEEHMTYPGIDASQVPAAGELAPQFQRPTQTQVVYHNTHGDTRTLTHTTEYDTAGRITKYADKDGTVTETTYDAQIPAGRLFSFGLPLTETTTGTDNVTRRTTNELSDDRTSVRKSITEVRQNPAEQFELASHTEQTVDADGFVSQQKVVSHDAHSGGPSEVATTFARTVDANTVTITETNAAGTPAATTHTVTTDKATGLVIDDTDSIGRVATTRYDVLGRATLHTNHANLEYLTTYDTLATHRTSPDGVTRSEHEDALGRLVKATDNIRDGKVSAGYERTVETRSYEKNGSVVTVTDAWGAKTTTEHDIFGRVTETTNPNGLRKTNTFDDVNGTITEAILTSDGSAPARIITSVKDNADRVVEKTTTAGGTVLSSAHTEYDGLGRTTRTTRDDVDTHMTLNADGTKRTTTLTPTSDVFGGSPITTTREHNVLGESTRKTLSTDGEEARHGGEKLYDAAGRVTQETDQESGATTYTYTRDGLVHETHEQRSATTTRYQHDPVTRNVTHVETVRDGTSSVRAFEYDRATNNTTAIFDPAAADATRIRYTHDAHRNLTSTVYPDGKTISHSYDEHGRAATTTDIAGNATRYEYDAVGFTTQVTQLRPDGTHLAGVSYTYDQYGRTTSLARDNNTRTEYTHTPMDQIASESTTVNGRPVADSTYTYDTHGNLTARTDTRSVDADDRSESVSAPSGSAHATADATETTTYTYDAYNRLTASAIYDGTAPAGQPLETHAYAMTVSSDIAQHSTTRAGETETRAFEYNTLGHLVAVTAGDQRSTQTYDAAGNLIQAADGSTYTYNEHNQTATETRPDGTLVETSYWIDGTARTTTRSSASARDGVSETPADSSLNVNAAASHAGARLHTETTTKYWDGTTLTNEVHGDGRTSGYLLGATRHARTLDAASPTDATVEYYLTDRHGNVAATTDATGAITNEYRYSDYGIPTHTFGATDGAERNPYQYSGEYTNALTATQALGERTYNPHTMRFITEDTAKLHNLYAYANANPITHTDPSGRTTVDDFITQGGFAAIGFGLVSVAFFLLLPLGNPVFFAIEGIAGSYALIVDAIQVVDTLSDNIEIPYETHQYLAASAFLAGVFTLWTHGVGFNHNFEDWVPLLKTRVNKGHEKWAIERQLRLDKSDDPSIQSDAAWLTNFNLRRKTTAKTPLLLLDEGSPFSSQRASISSRHASATEARPSSPETPALTERAKTFFAEVQYEFDTWWLRVKQGPIDYGGTSRVQSDDLRASRGGPRDTQDSELESFSGAGLPRTASGTGVPHSQNQSYIRLEDELTSSD